MKAELVLGNLRREREALQGKLERLETALGKEWEDVDQEYLCAQQYNAMSLYAHILDERIMDIEDKLEEKREARAMAEEDDGKLVFNKEIDLGSCRKETCKACDEDKEDDDCDCAVCNLIRMIEDIFGVEIK